MFLFSDLLIYDSYFVDTAVFIVLGVELQAPKMPIYTSRPSWLHQNYSVSPRKYSGSHLCTILCIFYYNT